MDRRIVSTVVSLLLGGAAAQQYQLVASYTPSNFFENFEFFTAPDPTDGFVQFVDNTSALSTGLAAATTDLIYLGVDHTNVYPTTGPGRPSVRVQSKMAFTEGLFVLDLAHMPVGCGTWPAYWTVGPEWPRFGEIDILEGINDATQNGAALHVDGDCIVGEVTGQTATLTNTNCSAQHNGNVGCTAQFNEPDNYGQGFNLNGGGTYVMEWTNISISIWFFPPDLVPFSLSGAYSFDSRISFPNTATFGPPSAVFEGPCSDYFPAKFYNHSIVFDTAFCGDWAGDAYSSSSCPKAPGLSGKDACEDFVARNPAAFTQAWWGIRSLRVWQNVVSYETPFSALNDPEATVPVLGHGAIQFPSVGDADAVDVSEPLSALPSNETLDQTTPVLSSEPSLSSDDALLDSISELLPEPELLDETYSSISAATTTEPLNFLLDSTVESLPPSPLLALSSGLLRAPEAWDQATSLPGPAASLLTGTAAQNLGSALLPSGSVLGLTPTETLGVSALDTFDTVTDFDPSLVDSPSLTPTETLGVGALDTFDTVTAFDPSLVDSPSFTPTETLGVDTLDTFDTVTDFDPSPVDLPSLTPTETLGVGAIDTFDTVTDFDPSPVDSPSLNPVESEPSLVASQQLLGIPTPSATLSSGELPSISPTNAPLPSSQLLDSFGPPLIDDVAGGTADLPPQNQDKLDTLVKVLGLLTELVELLSPTEPVDSADFALEAPFTEPLSWNSTQSLDFPTSNSSSNSTRTSFFPSSLDASEDEVSSDLAAEVPFDIVEPDTLNSLHQRELEEPEPVDLPYAYSYPSGESGDWVTVEVPPAFEDEDEASGESDPPLDGFTAFWNNGLNPIYDDGHISEDFEASELSAEPASVTPDTSTSPAESSVVSADYLELPAESPLAAPDTLILPAESLALPDEAVNEGAEPNTIPPPFSASS